MISIVFYIAAIVAIVSTVMVITRLNAFHALLYLVVSLLSVAIIFYIVGAPFIAALEVITYAGAIMILFIFVIMMLNLGKKAVENERSILNSKMWLGPGILAAILFFEFFYIFFANQGYNVSEEIITPKQVGLSLFTTYIIGVEIAAMMLMAGVIGAYHLGYKKKEITHRYFQGDTDT